MLSHIENLASGSFVLFSTQKGIAHRPVQRAAHLQRSLTHRRRFLGYRGCIAERLEQRGVDVAAADDGDVHPGVGQLMGVKQECGWSDGAAGLGYGFSGGGEQARGFANFILGHGDDVVDIGADVFEIDGADALSTKAVGECLGNFFGGEGNDVAGAQTGLGVACKFGFDADHLYLLLAGQGMAEFEGRSDAADQSSAADGDEHGFYGGQVFEDFEADGSLAGDDLLVVEGRHDEVSVSGGELFGAETALLAARADEDDLGSEGGGGFEFVLGSITGHDDDRLHAERAGRVGYALGVIAAGVGNDSAAAFVGS